MITIHMVPSTMKIKYNKKIQDVASSYNQENEGKK